MIINKDNIEQLAFEKMQGLLPVIVQDAFSGVVLMQGYMDRTAVEKTLQSGLVTFFSRSKQRLWTKGERSGHTLTLVELSADCDQDCLLALARPKGPTCHTGTPTCWHQGGSPQLAFLGQLETLLAERKAASPQGSYTAKLYASGIKRIAQKVGEEGLETALAAVAGDRQELTNEAADLLYHLLVLLQASDLQLAEVIQVLQARHAKIAP